MIVHGQRLCTNQVAVRDKYCPYLTGFVCEDRHVMNDNYTYRVHSCP